MKIDILGEPCIADNERRVTMFILQILATMATSILVAVLYACEFEWNVHKHVMHKVFHGFSYPFVAHALTHHQLFKADKTYHIQEGVDSSKICMAWWNGPVLILLGLVPFGLLAAFTWYFAPILTAVMLATVLFVFAAYYGAYEYLHWCMHLPRRRRLEFSRAFRVLNGHHILHHRWHTTNFNVVLPLADYWHGTLLTRAKWTFPQVRGYAVPDLQPM